ncbi:c-type cytochrome [Chitinophaga sp. Cy-1792]|uniref:c-type cytochrome n=1 Tax=Chitinophaga sp. Cy-1792 TaxID=2608339 RepID=UPI0014217015|nr:c-type cytochrome [Chitinophaga sp. Cy-1792]NIG53366.1 c-type cytochrome [Chitinophaga sp. Cy-1792]
MKLKKSVVVVAAALIAAGSLCSLSLPQQPEGPKNLKVLPKDISHDQLIAVMHNFNTSLSVKCNFCHAPGKDDPKKMDFASDDNPHKDIARDMMRMTDSINTNFFKGSATMTVTCYTCHHGDKEPVSKPAEGQTPPPPPQQPASTK